MALFAALGVLLLGLGRSVDAAALAVRQSERPSSDDFIRRSWHEVALVDDYLYIYAGEISQFLDGEPDARNKSRGVNTTLSIDLSKSWASDSVDIQSADRTAIAFGKNPGVWKDPNSSSFFTFGGDRGRNGIPFSKESQFRQFTADGKGSGSWSSPQPSNPDVFDDILPTAYLASTTCAGLGVFTGSYANSWTTNKVDEETIRPVAGLITYDLDSRAWANVSMDAYKHSSSYGELVCLDSYGDDGLVMFLGGVSFEGVSKPTQGAKDLTPFEMKNITLYDPKSDSWYWQVTTGDHPSGRLGFCAVTATSENSTEIFMYGGHPGDGSTLDELYILTIPGFHWIKGPSGSERTGNRCVKAGGRQMISVGGMTRIFNSVVGWGIKDPWAQGLGVLDMTSLLWSGNYDAGADKYTSPAVVKEWYKNGGLSSVFWSNEDSKKLFASTKKGETSSPETPNDPSPEEPKDEKSGPPAGAIAGGVVGGLAAIALIGLGIWMFRRRRRSQQAPSELPHETAMPTKHDSAFVSNQGTAQTPVESPAGNFYKPELDSMYIHELPPSTIPPPQELPTTYHDGGTQSRGR